MGLWIRHRGTGDHGCVQSENVIDAVVREILPDGVSYEQNGEIHALSGYDTIVLALGVRANNPLEETVKSLKLQHLGDYMR